MHPGLVIGTAVVYLIILFGIGYFGSKLARNGKKIIQNGYTYALSLAVYCTAWTFFGSIGRASTNGVDFLTIYIGPTLMAPLWFVVLRKIILISKSQKITSLADFVSARYGKSTLLGAVATTFLLIGIVPYIALQLKAVTSSFSLALSSSSIPDAVLNEAHFYQDSAFYITIVLAIFTIVFGASHLESSRQNQGLVTAIAFESLIKLFAFLVAGLFVVYGIYHGFGDLFSQAYEHERLQAFFDADMTSIQPMDWFFHLLLSMFAIFLLPRQFHMAVVENSDINHLKKSMWLFPLYLFIINIFVLPIALGGYLYFDGVMVDADTYILSLPLAEGNSVIALIVLVGGLSAATGMVIVSTVALSIMVNNHLLIPLLLRSRRLSGSPMNVSSSLIGFRRLISSAILLIAYSYFRSVGEAQSLISIGLTSFVAVAQFAPLLLGGIYWKGGTKSGAIAGLVVGFLIWAYCLPLATLAGNGIISGGFLQHGLFGIEWLKPDAILGLDGMDEISHATFWSLLANILTYTMVSLNSQPSPLEASQAEMFVDIDRYTQTNELPVLQSKARISDLELLLNRFMNAKRANRFIQRLAKQHNINLKTTTEASPALIDDVEKALASILGASSAKLLISSVAQQKKQTLQEVLSVLDETQKLMRYSKALEVKSAELEEAGKQLQQANSRLKAMDKVKDEFLTTITHELRTPITSIKSLAHILFENKDLEKAKQQEFLQIVVKESDRIAKLINQVLDMEKMASGMVEWDMQEIDLEQLGLDALQRLHSVIKKRGISLESDLSCNHPIVEGDYDRLLQVVINILSNAIKFCDPDEGKIIIKLDSDEQQVSLSIEDNGIGIAEESLPFIFDKFTQFTNYKKGHSYGSGLGLSISRQIMLHHKGDIIVKSRVGKGSQFFIHLPKKTRELQIQSS